MTGGAVGSIDLRDGEDLSPAYIGDFFRPFAVLGGALALVNRIIDDREYVSWCADNSYDHANGFVKVVLGVSAAGRKLVWHQWDDIMSDWRADIHNHRWDFVSYVCRGVIELEDFEERAEGAVGVACYRYRSPGELRSFTLDHVGFGALERTRYRALNAGHFYYQPHALVHRASPLAVGTSTLIVQGRAEAVETDVYTDRSNQVNRLCRGAERLSVSEIARLLARLREDLSQSC